MRDERHSSGLGLAIILGVMFWAGFAVGWMI